MYCAEGVADLDPMKQYMLTFDVGHEKEERNPWFRDGGHDWGVGERPGCLEHVSMVDYPATDGFTSLKCRGMSDNKLLETET